MDTCPTAAELRRAMQGDLQAARQEQIERHLAQCVICQQVLDAEVDRAGVVPASLESPGDWRDSAALQQAIQQLIDGHTAAEAGSQSVPEYEEGQIRFPFLQPPTLPGFLGRLGPYAIRRLLGRGGMSFVFEAFDPLLKRTVAVKVLSPLAAATEDSRQRLLREAQAAAALSHENIIGIHGIHLDADVPFLVLQFVEGESLADRLRRAGRLPLYEVVRIGLETAHGLAAAHAKGLIHRDIKPGNLLLEHATGRVKIADFGLVKDQNNATLTMEGTVAGTPEFMSPEQAAGQQLDARSDLFSLGAVLYLAATGTSPFTGTSACLVLERVRRASPRPIQQVEPSLPAWFCAIVTRLMAKEPRDRIDSAVQLVEMLERSHSPAPLPRRFSARVAWLLAGLAGLFLGLAVVGLAMRSVPGRPGDTLAPVTPPENRFLIVGRPEHHRELGEALRLARDGDVIEIYGDGPFLTPGLIVEGKRLTIRAAHPSRPVLLSTAPSRASPAPLILTDADLRLEGLTIHWRADAPPPIKSEPSMRSSAVVASTRGALQLAHCRIVAAAGSTCIVAFGPELAVTCCHLLSEEGAAIFWKPSPQGHASLDGCVVEGNIGVALPTAAVTQGLAPARLSLVHNTFAVDKSLQLVIQLGPKQPLHVEAYYNIFDHTEVVSFYATRVPRNFLPGTPARTVDLLRALLQWSDEGNLYRRGQTLGLYSILAPRERQRTPFARLEDWHAVWDMTNTGSAEGKIWFQHRPGREADALRLERVEDPSAPVPPGVGADPDQVGPRR
jgi:hypothetical protein